MADIFAELSKDAVVKSIVKTKKDRVAFPGFGSFTKNTSSRNGGDSEVEVITYKNWGEKVKAGTPAKRVVKFKAGADLADNVKATIAEQQTIKVETKEVVREEQDEVAIESYKEAETETTTIVVPLEEEIVEDYE